MVFSANTAKRHAVALCHAHDTRACAARLRSVLESLSVSCWTPPDARTGSTCLTPDIDAIDASGLPLFLLSAEAIRTPGFVRAVAHAVAHCPRIVALRVDHAPMPTTLEYYVGDLRTFDARNAPIDQAIDRIAAHVASVMRDLDA